MIINIVKYIWIAFLMASCSDPISTNEYVECNENQVGIFGQCYSIETTTTIIYPTYHHGEWTAGEIDEYLVGRIPPEIGQLINLTHLSLGNEPEPPFGCSPCGNEIYGEIPPEIGQLINLNYLDLSNNSLTGIIPEEICNQGDISPNLNNNYLCPPYPDCGLGAITSEAFQNTSNCGD